MMMTCRSLLAVLALLWIPATSALAAVRIVRTGATYSSVQAAYNAAISGDTIEIESGTYYQSYGWVYVNGKHNITFRGVGPTRPVIDAGGTALRSKGIFVIEIGTNNITIENLELKNARLTASQGANGAGVRAQGTNLTLRNCYIHDCDNGVLNGSGDLLFEYCEFAGNGYGDGYSHNMYVGGNTFTLRHCYVHDADGGHEVKTRAKVNYILYNRISNETGSASRELQIANGGTAYVIGNVIVQGNGGNSQIITYGDEYSIAPYRNPNPYLYVINNTIVNQRWNGAYFITNADSASTALIQNNIFHRLSSGSQTILSGVGTMVNNWSTTNAFFADPGAHDYHLTAASTGAINMGTDPGLGFNNYDLAPIYQYIHSCSREDRPTSGAIDIGAYEYVEPNQPPTVEAGEDLDVYEGTLVQLHATADDPDDDPLTYAWSQTAGAAVSLSGADTADASFEAPTLGTSLAEATLTLTVDVTDGRGGNAGDSLNVRVWLLGDVDQDDQVSVLDIVAVVALFGKTPADEGWNGRCDLDGDGEISVLDIVAGVANFGRALE